MGKTSIEWTDETWNPISGCTRVGPDCEHCYAERIAHRFRDLPDHPLYQLTRPSGVWAGRIRVNDHKIDEPLHWAKPRHCFVNSMSDLYHLEVPEDTRDTIYAVMAAARRHTFQVLTKRPDVRLDYLSSPGRRAEIALLNDKRHAHYRYHNHEVRESAWPLPNVWEGTSIGVRSGLHRLEPTRLTPAAIRFLSLEPLLEDLGELDLTGIHWVIVGGESGGHARECQVDWIRSIVRQCAAQHVACFVKQLGSNIRIGRARVRGLGPKGGNTDGWPPELRVRQYPHAA